MTARDFVHLGDSKTVFIVKSCNIRPTFFLKVNKSYWLNGEFKYEFDSRDWFSRITSFQKLNKWDKGMYLFHWGIIYNNFNKIIYRIYF